MVSINGKSILIIDDDAAVLRALKKVLSAEGAQVTSASGAGEAMEHLTDKPARIDLIITDLRMPILNGQSVLRAVKAALPEVPVIVITAYGSPEKQSECWKDGAAAFLEKPLDTPQLLTAIDGVFSTHQADPHRHACRPHRL